MNTADTESVIEFVHERGQRRPADWRKDPAELPQLSPVVHDGLNAAMPSEDRLVDEAAKQAGESRSRVRVGSVSDFPLAGGSTIKYGQSQIAVFHFASRGEWYATQNMCPHKQSFVLSRGILGDQNGTPKVARPLHKKTFSLEDGSCITGENYSLHVFGVEVRGDDVYLHLPPEELLDATLATDLHCIRVCPSHPSEPAAAAALA